MNSRTIKVADGYKLAVNGVVVTPQELESWSSSRISRFDYSHSLFVIHIIVLAIIYTKSIWCDRQFTWSRW